MRYAMSKILRSDVDLSAGPTVHSVSRLPSGRLTVHSLTIRLIVLACGLLLAACGGAGLGTPTAIPASVVRPDQPTPVYSTAQPEFRLDTATRPAVFITPVEQIALQPPPRTTRVPLRPIMPQTPSALGIATGGATLLDSPAGRSLLSLPAGATVTVTGRSSDGRWLAAFTSDGVAGWVAATALRLYGADDLTVVEEAISMEPVAMILAEAMKPVGRSMSEYLQSLTATPEPSVMMDAPSNGVVISSIRLNLRNAPDRSASIVGKIEPQANVTALARSADGAWLQVQSASGEGWVSAEFVRLNDDLGALPVAE